MLWPFQCQIKLIWNQPHYYSHLLLRMWRIFLVDLANPIFLHFKCKSDRPLQEWDIVAFISFDSFLLSNWGRYYMLDWYVKGQASVKAVTRPTVRALNNAALTAYQSVSFQPRTPGKMSAVTNDATQDFHLNVRGHCSPPPGVWILILKKLQKVMWPQMWTVRKGKKRRGGNRSNEEKLWAKGSLRTSTISHIWLFRLRY